MHSEVLHIRDVYDESNKALMFSVVLFHLSYC